MIVMHMIETNRVRYEKLTADHSDLGAWTRTWQGGNYTHVYTHCYTTGRREELLVALHVVNHNNPEHDQYFVWDEVELGVTTKEVQ